jgi:hypothetical protein
MLLAVEINNGVEWWSYKKKLIIKDVEENDRGFEIFLAYFPNFEKMKGNL